MKDAGLLPGFVFTDASATPWRASSVASKVQVKDLGTVNGAAMQLVHYEPGASFPIHHHPGPEFIYVPEGELIHHGRKLTPGWASVAVTGTMDREVRSETGCTFLTVYTESPAS